MNIRLLESDVEGQAWNSFLLRQPESSVYHRWEWRSIYSNAYGFKPRYWAAFDKEDVCGVFPAVLMRALNMRRVWVSLPFLQAAGPICISGEAGSAFAEEVLACEKAAGVKSFQVRTTADVNRVS